MEFNRVQLAWIGARLKEIRELQRVTMAELGLRMGIGRASVANTESMRRDLSISRFIRQCEALGVSPSAALDGLPNESTGWNQPVPSAEANKKWLIDFLKLDKKAASAIATGFPDDKQFAERIRRLVTFHPHLREDAKQYIEDYWRVHPENRAKE